MTSRAAREEADERDVLREAAAFLRSIEWTDVPTAWDAADLTERLDAADKSVRALLDSTRQPADEIAQLKIERDDVDEDRSQWQHSAQDWLLRAEVAEADCKKLRDERDALIVRIREIARPKVPKKDRHTVIPVTDPAWFWRLYDALEREIAYLRRGVRLGRAKGRERQSLSSRVQELAVQFGFAEPNGPVDTDALKHRLEDHQRWSVEVRQLHQENERLRLALTELQARRLANEDTPCYTAQCGGCEFEIGWPIGEPDPLCDSCLIKNALGETGGSHD